ncbi:MAG TPA: methionyl-tRNA formyltransferase [Candidatus Limnocylindrales bacterium]
MAMADQASKPSARPRTPSPDERARIVFLGSGAFAVPILERLLAEPGAQVLAVVSAPDRPAGRGGAVRPVPVVDLARARGIRVLQPIRLRSAAAIADIGTLRPDLGVLADYGQLVPAEVLAIPPRGMVNLHPSLLPRHRGATPIPATILAGDRQTGVSLFLMDAGLDSGPLIDQETVPLSGAETAPELETTLAEVAAGLLVRSLGPWLRRELPAAPQPGVGASLSRPLRREDGRLDPGRPAIELERQVRAYRGWPGSYLETSAGRLAVLRGSLAQGGPAAPGSIVAVAAGLGLVTADGVLVLDEVQPAGGRPMSGEAYRRGHPAIVG